MYYNKVCRLQPVKYVQLHQEDEPRNTIDANITVGAIFLGPQYNLKDVYFFDILFTGKCPRLSHWIPINMNDDLVKRYDTFNIKGFPDELFFGDFYDQPIPPDYYNLLNDNDDHDNNIPVNPVDGVFP